MSNKTPQLSEHFLFEKVVDKEHANQRFGGTATPALKSGIASLAKSVGLEFTELLRRAAFAADADPSSLFSDDVEAREKAFKESAFKQGGAHQAGKTIKNTPD
ncbi:MAG: hypothetical protein AAF244_04320 [Pseudomonadota bacterium]